MSVGGKRGRVKSLSFQFADLESQGILAWKTVLPSEVRRCKEFDGSRTPKGGHQRVTCEELAGCPPTLVFPGCALLWPTARLYFPVSHMWPHVEFSKWKRKNTWCLFLAYKPICACTASPSASR